MSYRWLLKNNPHCVCCPELGKCVERHNFYDSKMCKIIWMPRSKRTFWDALMFWLFY